MPKQEGSSVGERPVSLYQMMEILLDMFQEFRDEMNQRFENHNHKKTRQHFDKVMQVLQRCRYPNAPHGHQARPEHEYVNAEEPGESKDDFTTNGEPGVTPFEKQKISQIWLNLNV